MTISTPGMLRARSAALSARHCAPPAFQLDVSPRVGSRRPPQPCGSSPGANPVVCDRTRALPLLFQAVLPWVIPGTSPTGKTALRAQAPATALGRSRHTSPLWPTTGPRRAIGAMGEPLLVGSRAAEHFRRGEPALRCMSGAGDGVAQLERSELRAGLRELEPKVAAFRGLVQGEKLCNVVAELEMESGQDGCAPLPRDSGGSGRPHARGVVCAAPRDANHSHHHGSTHLRSLFNDTAPGVIPERDVSA